MTKAELIEALEMYPDDVEVRVNAWADLDGQGGQYYMHRIVALEHHVDVSTGQPQDGRLLIVASAD